MQRIASILPKGEGFSEASSGAIALSVRDFTTHSRWNHSTIVIGGTTGEGFPGIDYKPVPPARWFQNRTRAYANNCAKIIKRERIALAEIHNRPSIFHRIADKVSCKLVLHLHNDPQDMDMARTPQERQTLLERTTGIYCVSEYIRRRFLEGLENPDLSKLHVIYNGITLTAPVAKKEKLIVFAGRMTEDKGALPLAQALRMALPQLDGWRAILIGSRRFEISKQPSVYETQLADTLVPLGQQAMLTGYIPHGEVLATFARAAIAVVPSLWQEPFGRTALEAMANGVALISSGSGGLQEITRDAAIDVQPVSAESLADAILALARQPERCSELGRKGRERAQHFSIAQCTQSLDDARAIILGEPVLHGA